MLPVSVCDKVRLKTRRGPISVTPVVVDFRQLLSRESDQLLAQSLGCDKVSSPSSLELLQTLLTLYADHLRELPSDSINRIVCAEGVRTLVLLREPEEILREWKKKQQHISSLTTGEKSGSGGPEPREPRQVQPSGSFVSQCSSRSGGGPLSKSTNFDGSPGEGQEQRLTHDITCSSGFHSQDEELGPMFGDIFGENFGQGFGNKWEENSQRKRGSRGRREAASEQAEKELKRNVWRDSSSSESSSSEIEKDGSQEIERPEDGEEEEEEDVEGALKEETKGHEEGGRLEEALKGLDIFWDEREKRRRKREEAAEEGSLSLTHVALENRVMGGLSFHKDYSLPSSKLLVIDLMVVARPYQGEGVGRFLLKKVKNCTLVGPYNIVSVTSPAERIEYFRKNGFCDDLILSRKLSQSMRRDFEQTTGIPRGRGPWLDRGVPLFYLPPFSGCYPTLLGSIEMNSYLAFRTMCHEIESWREKSLDAYQEEVCLILRLKKEVCRLHSLLKKESNQVDILRSENKALKQLLSESSALNTMAAVDELDAVFSNLKTLYKLVSD